MDREDNSVNPEEFIEGINFHRIAENSREEFIDFLQEWTDSEEFDEEDLERIDPVRLENNSPDEIIESLDHSLEEYDLGELVEVAEELADEDWQDIPEFSGTESIEDIEKKDLVERAKPPREKALYDLPDNVKEGVFFDHERPTYLLHHDWEDPWYRIVVKDVDQEEAYELFDKAQKFHPLHHLVEIAYGEENLFVEPQQVAEYLGHKDEFQDEEELYFVATYSQNSNITLERTDGKDEDDIVYRFEMEVGGEHTDYLEILDPIFADKMVQGLKTRIQLESMDQV